MTRRIIAYGTLAALVILAAQSARAAGIRSESIFEDPNLEKVVREYVFEKRDNEEPLTVEDVENISTITGKGKEITSLAGLEHCRSLALLDLEDNQISDLSPISELTNIQSLTLAGNRIQDLTPLVGLVKLQYLDLSRNQVQDLNPLEAMENMRSLYLSGNQVEDITVVAKLTKVWSLYLDQNRVVDLSPLAESRFLATLDVAGNGVEDLSPLRNLTNLNNLFLQNNQLTDLQTLVDMAAADAEGERRFSPFWRVYLQNNPLSESALNEQIPRLKELGGRVLLTDE